VQFAMHFGVRASGVLLSSSALRGRVSAHQVEAEAVGVPARQDDVADVAGDRRSVLVERIGETPAPSLLVEILDLVSNSPDPVPAHGLDRAEPRTSEAGIGDQDRLAAVGQNELETAQELAMSIRAIVALERKHTRIDHHGPRRRGRRP
jgi:hypothetical protein